MAQFNVCIEVRTIRIYTVEALGETHAIEKARVLAEQDDDVTETLGGTAEEITTEAE